MSTNGLNKPVRKHFRRFDIKIHTYTRGATFSVEVIALLRPRSFISHLLIIFGFLSLVSRAEYSDLSKTFDTDAP